MAGGFIKGLTVKIGGDTTELGKALKDVEFKSRNLSSELRDIEKLLKMDPGNVELIAQKQDILKEAIAATAQKLETLREAEKQVQAQFERGEVSRDQVIALQREITRTENALKSYERQADQCADELDRLGQEADDSSQDQKELGDAAEKAGKSAEKSGDGFTIMGGALASLTADAIRSAINAIGDLVSSLFELSEATEEYRSMQGKVAASAKNNGYSMEFASQQYEKFYKYAADDQQAANAITNLMGLQTSTDSLSSIIDGAIGAWASYGDSIPLESLTESINETIQVGKVTGTFADTINWAKISNEEFSAALGDNSEAQKAFNKAIEDGEAVEDAFSAALASTTDTQERADIVARFLNQTYGESKSTYDEMTGSIQDANAAESSLKETQAQLGQAIEPVNTALTNLKNQALQAITPLVEQLADAFLNLLNWLKENPAAMDAVTAVVAGLAAAFGVLATALAIQGIISGVTKAIALLNGTMLANPIVLIVAAIAGLVAAFVVLWNKCEWFRNFWIGLWENIKTAFAAVVSWLSSAAQSIGQFFINAWQSIQGAWASAGEWFSGIWSSICSAFSSVGPWFSEVFSSAWSGIQSAWSGVTGWFGSVWAGISGAFSSAGSWFSSTFSSAWNGIKNAFSGVKTFFAGVWSDIKNAFSDALSGMASIGSDIVTGLWNGINNMTSWIAEKIKGFCSNALDAIKNFFGIASPSRVMRDVVGKNIGLGMAEGITNSIGAVEDAMNDLGGAAMRGMDAVAFDGPSLERSLQKQNAQMAMTYTTSFDASMMDKLDKILHAIESGQVLTLDGKALIGRTANQYDRTLGQRRILIERGAV